MKPILDQNENKPIDHPSMINFDHDKATSGIRQQKVDSDGKIIIELMLQNRQDFQQGIHYLVVSCRTMMFFLGVLQIFGKNLNPHENIVFSIPLLNLLLVIIIVAIWELRLKFLSEMSQHIEIEVFRLLERDNNEVEDAFIRSRYFDNVMVSRILRFEPWIWALANCFISLAIQFAK